MWPEWSAKTDVPEEERDRLDDLGCHEDQEHEGQEQDRPLALPPGQRDPGERPEDDRDDGRPHGRDDRGLHRVLDGGIGQARPVAVQADAVPRDHRPAVVERVHDDHEDRKEEEHVDEDRP